MQASRSTEVKYRPVLLIYECGPQPNPPQGRFKSSDIPYRQFPLELLLVPRSPPCAGIHRRFRRHHCRLSPGPHQRGRGRRLRSHPQHPRLTPNITPRRVVQRVPLKHAPVAHGSKAPDAPDQLLRPVHSQLHLNLAVRSSELLHSREYSAPFPQPPL